MKFSILLLTIGIPGSGKTTWVESYHQTYPRSFVISTDNIREELFGTSVCNPNQNEMVHTEARRRVKEILDNPKYYEGEYPLGPTIVVDSTNCEPFEWFSYKRLGATINIAKIFPITPEQAMQRQQERDRIVPFSVLENKWHTYLKHKDLIPKIFNMII